MCHPGDVGIVQPSCQGCPMSRLFVHPHAICAMGHSGRLSLLGLGIFSATADRRRALMDQLMNRSSPYRTTHAGQTHRKEFFQKLNWLLGLPRSNSFLEFARVEEIFDGVT